LCHHEALALSIFLMQLARYLSSLYNSALLSTNAVSPEVAAEKTTE